MKNIGTIDTALGKAAVMLGQYWDGNPAIKLVLETGEPLATLSVNLPDQLDTLGPGEFFVKNYSENVRVAGEAAKATHIFEPVSGKTGVAGHVSDLPVWRLKGWPFEDEIQVEVTV